MPDLEKMGQYIGLLKERRSGALPPPPSSSLKQQPSELPVVETGEKPWELPDWQEFVLQERVTDQQRALLADLERSEPKRGDRAYMGLDDDGNPFVTRDKRGFPLYYDTTSKQLTIEPTNLPAVTDMITDTPLDLQIGTRGLEQLPEILKQKQIEYEAYQADVNMLRLADIKEQHTPDTGLVYVEDWAGARSPMEVDPIRAAKGQGVGKMAIAGGMQLVNIIDTVTDALLRSQLQTSGDFRTRDSNFLDMAATFIAGMNSMFPAGIITRVPAHVLNTYFGTDFEKDLDNEEPFDPKTGRRLTEHEAKLYTEQGIPVEWLPYRTGSNRALEYRWKQFRDVSEAAWDTYVKRWKDPTYAQNSMGTWHISEWEEVDGPLGPMMAPPHRMTKKEFNKIWDERTPAIFDLYLDGTLEEKQLAEEQMEEIVALQYEWSQGKLVNPFSAFTWNSDPDRFDAFLRAVAQGQIQLGRQLSANEIMNLRDSRFIDPWLEVAGGIGVDMITGTGPIGWAAKGAGKIFSGLKGPLMATSMGANIAQYARLHKPFTWFNQARFSAAKALDQSTRNTILKLAEGTHSASEGTTLLAGQRSLQEVADDIFRVVAEGDDDAIEALKLAHPSLGDEEIKTIRELTRIYSDGIALHGQKAPRSIKILEPEKIGLLVEEEVERLAQNIMVKTQDDVLAKLGVADITDPVLRSKEYRRALQIARRQALDQASKPKNLAAGLAKRFQQGYLDAHTPNLKLGKLDDSLVNWIFETTGATKSKGAVDAFKVLAGGFSWARQRFIDMLLPLRTGWTVYNMLDSSLRYWLKGGSFFDDWATIFSNKAVSNMLDEFVPAQVGETAMRTIDARTVLQKQTVLDAFYDGWRPGTINDLTGLEIPVIGDKTVPLLVPGSFIKRSFADKLAELKNLPPTDKAGGKAIRALTAPVRLTWDGLARAGKDFNSSIEIILRGRLAQQLYGPMFKTLDDYEWVKFLREMEEAGASAETVDLAYKIWRISGDNPEEFRALMREAAGVSEGDIIVSNLFPEGIYGKMTDQAGPYSFMRQERDLVLKPLRNTLREFFEDPMIKNLTPEEQSRKLVQLFNEMREDVNIKFASSGDPELDVARRGPHYDETGPSSQLNVELLEPEVEVPREQMAPGEVEVEEEIAELFGGVERPAKFKPKKYVNQVGEAYNDDMKKLNDLVDLQESLSDTLFDEGKIVESKRVRKVFRTLDQANRNIDHMLRVHGTFLKEGMPGPLRMSGDMAGRGWDFHDLARSYFINSLRKRMNDIMKAGEAGDFEKLAKLANPTFNEFMADAGMSFKFDDTGKVTKVTINVPGYKHSLSNEWISNKVIEHYFLQPNREVNWEWVFDQPYNRAIRSNVEQFMKGLSPDGMTNVDAAIRSARQARSRQVIITPRPFIEPQLKTPDYLITPLPEEAPFINILPAGEEVIELPGPSTWKYSRSEKIHKYGHRFTIIKEESGYVLREGDEVIETFDKLPKAKEYVADIDRPPVFEDFTYEKQGSIWVVRDKQGEPFGKTYTSQEKAEAAVKQALGIEEEVIEELPTEAAEEAVEIIDDGYRHLREAGYSEDAVFFAKRMDDAHAELIEISSKADELLDSERILQLQKTIEDAERALRDIAPDLDVQPRLPVPVEPTREESLRFLYYNFHDRAKRIIENVEEALLLDKNINEFLPEDDLTIWNTLKPLIISEGFSTRMQLRIAREHSTRAINRAIQELPDEKVIEIVYSLSGRKYPHAGDARNFLFTAYMKKLDSFDDRHFVYGALSLAREADDLFEDAMTLKKIALPPGDKPRFSSKLQDALPKTDDAAMIATGSGKLHERMMEVYANYIEQLTPAQLLREMPLEDLPGVKPLAELPPTLDLSRQRSALIQEVASKRLDQLAPDVQYAIRMEYLNMFDDLNNLTEGVPDWLSELYDLYGTTSKKFRTRVSRAITYEITNKLPHPNETQTMELMKDIRQIAARNTIYGSTLKITTVAEETTVAGHVLRPPYPNIMERAGYTPEEISRVIDEWVSLGKLGEAADQAGFLDGMAKYAQIQKIREDMFLEMWGDVVRAGEFEESISWLRQLPEEDIESPNILLRALDEEQSDLANTGLLSEEIRHALEYTEAQVRSFSDELENAMDQYLLPPPREAEITEIPPKGEMELTDMAGKKTTVQEPLITPPPTKEKPIVYPIMRRPQQLPPPSFWKMPDYWQTWYAKTSNQFAKRRSILKLLDEMESHVLEMIRTGDIKRAFIPAEEWGKISGAVDQGAVAKKSASNVAMYGGEEVEALGGTAYDGAVTEVGRHMLNYTEFSQFDEMMKFIFPFWMFPSRSIPYWMDMLTKNPYLLTFWKNYVRTSKQQAFRHGAITRRGETIPSLVGYMPIGETGIWINPIAPFSFNLVMRNRSPYVDEAELANASPMQEVAYYFSTVGGQFGFHPGPWINLFSQGILPDNLTPFGQNYIPLTQLVPPWHQRSVREWMMRTVNTDLPWAWEREVPWFDYEIERRMLEDLVAGLDTMPQAEIDKRLAEIYAALGYEVCDTCPGGYKLNIREDHPLWISTRRAVEESEYHRDLVGWSSGMYMKEFTDARAEVFSIRNDINRYRAAINDAILADAFLMDPIAEDRYNKYIEFAYNSPEGQVALLYGNLGWVRTADGSAPAGKEDRRQLIAGMIHEDMVTQEYYDTRTSYSEELAERLLSVATIGDSRELTSSYYKDYFAKLERLEDNPKYDLARREYNIGYKPTEMIEEYFEKTFWRELDRTKPQWRKDDGETYAEFQLREEAWLERLPTTAEELADEFFLEHMIQYSGRIAGNRTFDASSMAGKLLADADREGYLEWKKSNDTALDALNEAWRYLHFDKYWNAIEQIPEGSEGYWEQRELINRELEQEGPPSPESLIAWVMENYEDRFTVEELMDLAKGRNIASVSERLAPDTKAGEQKNRLWNVFNWVGPGAQYTAFRKEYLRLGGDEDMLATWYETGGDITFIKDQEEMDAFEKLVTQSAKNLNIQAPTEVELLERVEAKRLNSEFRAGVEREYGSGFYQEQGYYYNLNSAERKAYREANPEFAMHIKNYADLKEQFARENPLWAKYYAPDLDLEASKSAGYSYGGGSYNRGYRRRSGGGTGTAPKAVQPWLGMGMRGLTADELLTGRLGKGGITKKPYWPEGFVETVGPQVAQEVVNAVENNVPVSTPAEKFLSDVANRHEKYREFINTVLNKGGGGLKLIE